MKFNPEARLTECLDVKSKQDAQEWFDQYKVYHRGNPMVNANIRHMIGYYAKETKRKQLIKWYFNE